jgi:REP element-mobilizing transposase RayT
MIIIKKFLDLINFLKQNFFMANTYSQISIHAVFAVKGRENLITSKWRDQLHQYIAGIVNSIGAKSLSVGGWKDHVHVFFGMPVAVNISDIVGKLKRIVADG